MRILLVNKFHYIKGGSETYYFSLKKLLEEKGHEIIEFSMKDTRNIPSKFSDYFVENIDYNKKQPFHSKIKLAGKLIYSFEARKKLEKLIQDYKPDIAHLQIFQHQLSPSILSVLKKNNIPIVYTAHDLKMICPNYKMFNSGKICEKCNGGRYYNCIKNRCVKDSYVNSLISVIEAYAHKVLKSYDSIDKILTPSNFYREKFIEFGVNKERIEYVPNFLDSSNIEEKCNYEDYILYFGRLSEEKGIDVLIKAMKNISAKLKIVGTGPLEGSLKELTELEGLNHRIDYLGFKSGNELKDIIRRSMLIIVPSIWYENAPYSILEAMALGKVVIGSNIGGIPELVIDNETGLIFNVGDYQELSEKINLLINNRKLIDFYATNAIELLKNNFNKELHGEKVINIYEDLIKWRRNGNN